MTGAAAGVSRRCGRRASSKLSARGMGGNGAMGGMNPPLVDGGDESVSMTMSSSSSATPAAAMTTLGSLRTGRSVTRGILPLGAARETRWTVGNPPLDGGEDGGTLSASEPSISSTSGRA